MLMMTYELLGTIQQQSTSINRTYNIHLCCTNAREKCKCKRLYILRTANTSSRFGIVHRLHVKNATLPIGYTLQCHSHEIYIFR